MTKRKPCAYPGCTRQMNTLKGTEFCAVCRRLGRLSLSEPDETSYEPSEIFEVAAKAAWAYRKGIIPRYRVVETPESLHYEVAGVMLGVENFDLYVAHKMRERGVKYVREAVC